jgi:hypothetical protein
MSECRVPEGYKQTEVGVIPEDWEVLLLFEVCRSICDGTHYTPYYRTEQGRQFADPFIDLTGTDAKALLIPHHWLSARCWTKLTEK